MWPYQQQIVIDSLFRLVNDANFEGPENIIGIGLN